MTSAADFLQALQRRAQLQAHRLSPPGEFPEGWGEWLGAPRAPRAGAASAAPAQFVDVLASRPSAPRSYGPVEDLGRWGAFAAMWRQGWEPADRSERPTRRAAASFSGVWHIVLGALMLWALRASYIAPSAPPLGEDVVQIEFIGMGTPDDAGGGAPSAPSAGPLSVQAPVPAGAAPAAASASSATPAEPAPLPDVPQHDVPEPQLPTAPAPQPLEVSEAVPVESPDAFLVPPPQPPLPDVAMATRELQMPSPEVRVVDVPAPVQPIRTELPQPVLSPRVPEMRVPDVAAREIPAPLAPVAPPQVAAPAMSQPELRAPSRQVAERSISAPAPSPGEASTATASASSAPTSTAQGRSPSPVPGVAPAPGAGAPAATVGAGARPAGAPGGLASPRRADDWGDSSRNVPGGQRGSPSGLFDGEGRPRVGSAPGSASPGRPPGTVTQEIADLDRAGTWLKRPPTDYEPTAFDRYWRPNETLLQEWVRRSVREVFIPIPGTNKRIVCNVAMLALGGGCGISDPNLNEQPATARPPPDVPFKPHLQEDNGSVPPTN